MRLLFMPFSPAFFFLRFPATSSHSPQRSETMLFIAVILRTYDLFNFSLYDKFSDSGTIGPHLV
jgi:hypothetical protein